MDQAKLLWRFYLLAFVISLAVRAGLPRRRSCDSGLAGGSQNISGLSNQAAVAMDHAGGSSAADIDIAGQPGKSLSSASEKGCGSAGRGMALADAHRDGTGGEHLGRDRLALLRVTPAPENVSALDRCGHCGSFVGRLARAFIPVAGHGYAAIPLCLVELERDGHFNSAGVALESDGRQRLGSDALSRYLKHIRSGIWSAVVSLKSDRGLRGRGSFDFVYSRLAWTRNS